MQDAHGMYVAKSIHALEIRLSGNGRPKWFEFERCGRAGDGGDVSERARRFSPVLPPFLLVRIKHVHDAHECEMSSDMATALKLCMQLRTKVADR